MLYGLQSYRKETCPFAGDKIQLTRADIEWLLDTLGEDGGPFKGPIDWDQTEQRNRTGLDLRGARLNKLDLSDLPLAGAQLQFAELIYATLERTDLSGAHLWGASLNHAHMARVRLYQARLFNVEMYRTDLTNAYLVEASLSGASLSQSTLRGSILREADLGPIKTGTSRCEALRDELERLKGIDPEIVGDASTEDLKAADLSGSFLDSSTVLDDTILGDVDRGVYLVDIRFGDVGLGGIEWSNVTILGEESEVRAIQHKHRILNRENRELLREKCEIAIRANRQLSVALENQGLLDEAIYFIHRTKDLQRLQYWLKCEFVTLFISGLLNALTGDGYRIRNLLGWYLITLLGFAEIYYFASRWFGSTPIDAWRALYMSLLAFHRLPFPATPWFAPQYMSTIGIIESILGVAIEAGLIAAFTFRLLGR